MKMKQYDSYSTYTPPEEIDICEHCPYPKPICGANGCAHFREIKAKQLAQRGDKRQLRGKKKNEVQA